LTLSTSSDTVTRWPGFAGSFVQIMAWSSLSGLSITGAPLYLSRSSVVEGDSGPLFILTPSYIYAVKQGTNVGAHPYTDARNVESYPCAG